MIKCSVNKANRFINPESKRCFWRGSNFRDPGLVQKLCNETLSWQINYDVVERAPRALNYTSALSGLKKN